MQKQTYGDHDPKQPSTLKNFINNVIPKLLEFYMTVSPIWALHEKKGTKERQKKEQPCEFLRNWKT